MQCRDDTDCPVNTAKANSWILMCSEEWLKDGRHVHGLGQCVLGNKVSVRPFSVLMEVSSSSDAREQDNCVPAHLGLQKQGLYPAERMLFYLCAGLLQRNIWNLPANVRVTSA